MTTQTMRPTDRQQFASDEPHLQRKRTTCADRSVRRAERWMWLLLDPQVVREMYRHIAEVASISATRGRWRQSAALAHATEWHSTRTEQRENDHIARAPEFDAVVYSRRRDGAVRLLQQAVALANAIFDAGRLASSIASGPSTISEPTLAWGHSRQVAP